MECVGPAGQDTIQRRGSHFLDGCPRDSKHDGIALFIIDPQNDFHPPNGSLAVPGAVEDSQRIADLIESNGDAIGRIVVTLDTHHPMHIGHANFWVGNDGNRPPPFTPITAESIRAGQWRPRDEAMQEWALSYADQLEAGGRFTIFIWPDHCLLGSTGHAVHPVLNAALSAWSTSQGRCVEWLLKGQNNFTEMYSALRAEVEVPSDPSTKLNTSMIDFLAQHSKVVCCGEAKSHCVNYTMRDLLSAWPAGRAGDLVLLKDCCSSVPGFEAVGEQFENDMKQAGVVVCTSAELMSTCMTTGRV